MALEFACADYAFPLLSRQQCLHLIKLLGFRYVDLGLFARNPRFSPMEFIASPTEFTRQLKHDLDKAGLLVSDVFLQIGTDPAEYASTTLARWFADERATLSSKRWSFVPPWAALT